MLHDKLAAVISVLSVVGALSGLIANDWQWMAHELTYSNSLNYWLAQSHTHLHTHSHSLSLTHSLNHLLAHPLSHSHIRKHAQTLTYLQTCTRQLVDSPAGHDTCKGGAARPIPRHGPHHGVHRPESCGRLACLLTLFPV